MTPIPLRVRLLTSPAALAVLAFTACGSDGPVQPMDELPRELSAAERRVVSSGNAFALDLFQRLAAAEPEANLAASPLSAFYSLGMAANGAAGETLQAMRAALGQSGLDDEQANQAYRSLMDLLLGLDPGVEVRLANSVWYRAGFPVRPAFADLTRRVFAAEVRGLDFSAPSAPAAINGWVAEETRGRIEELVESIRAEEVVFLANAVYFHGRWQQTFAEDRTAPASFHRLDGSAVQVPMMHRAAAPVRHYEGAGFEAVELPYARGAFAMLVLLPEEGVPPSRLLAAGAAAWQGWMAGLAEGRMAVALPRFRVEWEKVLNDDLKAMGMALAFQAGRADFGRLAEEGTVRGSDLYISRVKQKAFVEVDEEGTEAAAATSTGIGIVSLPPTFRADRPFLYAIRERFSGTLLFVGQVTDPTAG